MSKYVVITDDPSSFRARRRDVDDWFQTEFASAADALAWERRHRARGVIALESQGWRYGCLFTEEPGRRVAVRDWSAKVA
jgi:hypothetical protein